MNFIRKKSRALSAILAFFLFVMVCIPTTVYAEGNASVTISADKTQVEAGDKVKVTVTVSADATLDKVNYALVYDKAVLSIKDSEGYDFNGRVKWAAIEVGSSKYVESFTFTALADGTASVHFENTPEVSGFVVTAGDPCVITVGSGAVAQPDESTEPSSDAEVSVVIPNSSEPQTEEETEPEVTYGTCDLKNLVIQPGTIEFDPAVTDYVVQVDAGTERILVQAETADPTSQYVVSGYESLVDGEENLVSIIVTSNAGETKTYNLHVLCGDAVYYEDFDVTVGEKVYTIKAFSSASLAPAGFVEASLTIGDYTANVFQNDELAARGMYLVYAAEGENSPVVCWYDVNDGSIFPYVEVGNPNAEVQLAEVQNAYVELSDKYNEDMAFRMKIIIGLVLVVAFVLLITIVQMFKIHRLEDALDDMEGEEEVPVKKKEDAPAPKVDKVVKKETKKKAVEKETAPAKEMEVADMGTEDISAAILAAMDETLIPAVENYEEETVDEEEEFFFEEVKKASIRMEKKEEPKIEVKKLDVTAPRRPTRERPQKPQVTRKKED